MKSIRVFILRCLLPVCIFFIVPKSNAQILTTLPSSVPFGNVCVGSSSIVQVNLSGTGLLGLLSVSTSGGAFKISLTGAPGTFTNSPLSLSVIGGLFSGKIFVQFTPAAAGSFSGSVSILGGGLLSPVLTSLAGIGTSPPSGLNYASSPVTICQNSPAGTITPTISGSPAITYTISPSLPSGLSLNATTGVVTGTPTVTAPTTSYVVTATNSCGSTSTNLIITVSPGAPVGLSFVTNPSVYCPNIQIAANNPVLAGGAPTNYAVVPALPPGLVLDPVTGVISGTPTTTQVASSYTVSASNSCGLSSTVLSIQVLTPAPQTVVYSSPDATYCQGTAIIPNTPSVTSGGVPTSYSVSPALPAGLVLDPVTGIISGIPTTTTAGTNYTVTASNTCGSVTAAVRIAVPKNLSITAQPVMPPAFCAGSGNVTTIVAATGNGVTYQWMVETVPGNGFAPVQDDTVYGGTATDTLVISKPNFGMNGYRYLVQISDSCTSGLTSDTVTLVIKQAPQAPDITYLPSIGSLSSPFCENSKNLNFKLSSNNPAGSVNYGWITADFVNAHLDTSGGPNNSIGIISLGKASGFAHITAVDTSLQTGCYAKKDTAIAVSNSSAQSDSVRIIWDGKDYIALNNTVTNYYWGYDDSSLVPHLFVAPTDGPYVDGQNFMPTAAANLKAKGGRVWCLTGLGNCLNKNYYMDPEPDMHHPPFESIGSGVRVYPNPVKDYALIQWPFSSSYDQAKIVVIDMLGRKRMTVFPAASTPGLAKVEFGKLTAGVYLLTVYQDNKMVASGKLIKIQN